MTCWGFRLVKISLVTSALTAAMTAGSDPIGPTVLTKPLVLSTV